MEQEIRDQLLAKTLEELTKRFDDALRSISEVVHFETIITDAVFSLPTDGEPLIDAEKTKKFWFIDMREALDRVIKEIADREQEPWQRVKAAFPDKFPPDEGTLPVKPVKAADEGTGSRGGEELFERCPPGFVEVGGICMPI